MMRFLFVVNGKNKPLKKKLTREQVHKNGLWHRTNHIWVLGANGRLLFVKRGEWKTHDPGKWASYVGGHLYFEENSLKGASRETKEELALNLNVSRLSLLFVNKSIEGKEFNETYLLKLDPSEKVRPSKKEFTDYKFIVPSRAIFRDISPDTLSGGKKYLEEQLKWL